MAIIAIWHKRQQGSGNPGIKGQKLSEGACWREEGAGGMQGVMKCTSAVL